MSTRYFCALVFLLVIQNAAKAGDLYAIIACDTDDERLGQAMKIDRENLTHLLKGLFEDPNVKMPGQLHLKVFEGRDVTDANIRGYLAGLRDQVKNSDTVFFFFSGHGGESNWANQRLQFTHDKKTYPRFYYEEAINALGPRLRILVCDCCAHHPRDIKNFVGKGKPGEQAARTSGFRAHPDVFRQLFFEGDQWVMLASSKKGTPSYGSNKEVGGYFTNAFVTCLSMSPDQIDADSKGVVTWEKFFNKVKNQTQAIYTQEPEAHYLNDCQEREYFVQFVNNTNEHIDLHVRVRGKHDPDNFVRGWYRYQVRAGENLLLVDENKEPMRVYAFQHFARGVTSRQVWVRSTDERAKDQSQARPVVINMGVQYNSGKDGKNIRTFVRSFDP